MLPQDEGQPFPPYDFPRVYVEVCKVSARKRQKAGRPPGKPAPPSSLPPSVPQLFPALQAPIRLLASGPPSESPHFPISSTSPQGALWKAVRLSLQQGNTRGRAPPPQRALGYRCRPGAAQSRLYPPRGPCGDLTVRTACAGSQCRDSQPRVSIPRGPLQGFSFRPAQLPGE